MISVVTLVSREMVDPDFFFIWITGLEGIIYIECQILGGLFPPPPQSEYLGAAAPQLLRP